jgi:ribonucleoside-triphosphate reductase
MQQPVAQAAARPSSNGNGNGRFLTMLKVQKRTGEEVPFDHSKIVHAVFRCFVNSCGHPDTEVTRKHATQVADQVSQILLFHEPPITVELIQDIVEKQLMALGFHDEAKQYILFRDLRRQQRDQHDLDPAVAVAFEADAPYFRTDLERFQHFDKYARFDENAGRRETFVEQKDRIHSFLRTHVRENTTGGLSVEEWDELERAYLENRASPSMRLVQMAGPAATRCNVSIYNCSFCGMSDIEYFAESLYILMQGTGHGFSVEAEFIEDLPRVKRQRGKRADTFVIPDHTEGWADAVKFGMTRWFDGHDAIFDDSLVRPEGTRLKTKGGTASGPAPLRRLLDFTRRTILGRQKRRLRDIDVHDMMCLTGDIVQVGGVRRAACISLSDLDSMEMRYAKHGQFWTDPLKKQRTMANNSAVYEQKPSAEEFLEEWLALMKSKSGERGIFNREAAYRMMPQRRRSLYSHVLWGGNPCGEIILHPKGQFCNLSIAIVRPYDTEETLSEKVRIAAIYGTLQSSMTKFRYLRPRWAENCERERLLGVDLLGAEDCPLLQEGNPGRPALLERLKKIAVETNLKYAHRLGIPASTAVTCIKPGGNSSVRFGTGQSMSGWLTKYMIRNVEVGKNNPIHQLLVDQGVPYETSYRDPNSSVFSWPLAAPEGSQIVAELQLTADGRPEGIKPNRSAIAQLEDWKCFKLHWTEHNPSVTIYVADHEWVDVGHWVFQNWDIVGGLSFLPLDGGIYPQAPYTPVTEEFFKDFVAKFPKIAWEKLPRYERTDMTAIGHEVACTGGVCTL